MAERVRGASVVGTAWLVIGLQAAVAAGVMAGLKDWGRLGAVLGRAVAGKPCHCLCALHSRDAPGVCDGMSEVGLSVWRFSMLTGTVAVPMCRPCFDAVGGR